MSRFKKFTKDHLIGISGIIIGAIITFVIPIFEIHWLEKADIAVEVTSIVKKLDDNTGILISKDKELSFLLKHIPTTYKSKIVQGQRIYFSSDEVKLNTEGLSRTVKAANRESDKLARKIKLLTDAKKSIDQESTNLNSSKIRKLFFKLRSERVEQLSSFSGRILYDDLFSFSELRFFESAVSEEKINKKNLLESLEAGVEKYTEEQTALLGNLSNAKIEIPKKLKLLNDKSSFFEITVSITNTGAAGTSIRRASLFRVYIGSSNYIDIRFSAQDLEKLEIPKAATKVVTFRSKPIENLLEDDQLFVSNHWNEGVQSILFIQDTYDKIHASKPISFSEGSYKKSIYDRLAVEASKVEYLEKAK